MDKDKKVEVACSDNTLDSDAEALLRDLDDEDDSDFESAMDEPAASGTLVNIFTSSSSLESISVSGMNDEDSNMSEKTADSTESKAEERSEDANHAESSKDDKSDDKADKEDSESASREESSSKDAPTKASEGECDSHDEETSESRPFYTEEPPRSESFGGLASALNSVRRIAPIASSVPSIAPISTPGINSVPALGKAVEAKNEAKEAAEVKAEMPKIEPFKEAAKKETARDAEADEDDKKEHRIGVSDGEKAVSADAKTVSADAKTSAPKRPPVPPKMPSMPAVNGRILRENEVAYTPEALNDILPGGKNDDGRDLAYKFTDNNWYAQVFNEDYLRTQPKNLPKKTVREAEFIAERLGIQSGARVLDLCCGAGRHTLELARKGYEMVGVDLSMFLLKKALSDAQARKLTIKFVHGDMRKLQFKSLFDAVYNVQTSFGYFDDLSNFKVLQSIYTSLKPGGVFLLETVNRDFIMNDLPLRLFWQGNECKLLEEVDMDALSGVLRIKRSVVLEDNSKPPYEQNISIRLYTAPEMRHLLSRAGFEVLELCGDYSLPANAYFGASSPYNIFVAEKPVNG